MPVAAQGQLSRLETLPEPDSTSLEPYTCKALMFKNSLTSLNLCCDCDSDSFQPQLAFRTLCHQIDQFKNLQHLDVSYLPDKYFSYFDGLINKCLHVKSLYFDLTIDEIRQPVELNPSTRSSSDIQTLECNSRLINTESQLECLMRKFPNLESFIVKYGPRIHGDTTPIFSGLTLIKFIFYNMSIPNSEINIDAKVKDLGYNL